MDTFVQGSPLHGICLLACLLAAVGTGLLARRYRGKEPMERRLRFVIVSGCLGSWLLTNGHHLVDGRFTWSESLPLHFCNLANLLGAHAVATRRRLSQSLLYFWTFSLCLWAFLTPSLYVGPASIWFWIFWIYHLFIPIATVWILVADRFRPTWRDWWRAVATTLLFMGALALLDAVTGWNYGFVGPSVPTQRNLLDFLGPYPLRLVWMVLVGTGFFTLCLLPWLWKRPVLPPRRHPSEK